LATKQIALGAILKLDTVAQGCLQSIQPPSRTYQRVDQTCLDDTLVTSLQGIEDSDDISFSQIWHPTDSNHELVETAFAAKATVAVDVVYPFATPVTDSFSALVTDIAPQTLEVNGIISRQVTLHRTTAVTRV
jgi:hypothetical protein